MDEIRRMPRRGRPLTLFEIVIVLALITMIAGVATWSLGGLLAKHRFQSSVDDLQNLLQELQIEALALGSDMELHFFREKDLWKVRSKTSEKILRDRTIELKGVQTILQNDLPKDKVDLKIFSSGRIEPTCIFQLQGRQGSLYIDLRQPLLIKFFEAYPGNEVSRTSIPARPQINE